MGVWLNLPFAGGGSGTGDITNGSNVGTGEGNVFKDKSGTSLRFKTLKQGSNITITDNTNDVTIASGGGVSDGDKGDITVSGSGATWTIDNSVVNADKLASNAVTTDKITNSNVTLAKIENIATNRILGRSTSGNGVIESLTLNDTRSLLNVEDGADVTDAVNIASSIVGVSAKTTPIDADSIGIIDSEASNSLKKSTWTNIKAFLKTYFDTLYQTALGFTAENVANKENSTIDTDTTKYPTINLLKTGLDTKQATLVNQSNIKSINGTTLLGSGDLVVSGISETPTAITASTASADSLILTSIQNVDVNLDANIDLESVIDTSTIQTGRLYRILCECDGTNRNVTCSTFDNAFSDSFAVTANTSVLFLLAKFDTKVHLFANDLSM
jgi:hypothetical protein